MICHLHQLSSWDYLYIIVIAEHEGLIEYYKKNGFEHIDGRHVFVVQNE